MENPTLKYNPSTKSWDPVTIRARLTSVGPAKLEAPALNPDFKVEDYPDAGAPGLGEKIIKISGRTLIGDGKEANKAVQFVVSVDTPRAEILENQMGFALKVTVKPLQISVPGMPIPQLFNDATGAITVFLEIPPDCITINPPANPLLIDSSREAPVALTAVAQAFDVAKREMVPDPAATIKYTVEQGPAFALLRKKEKPTTDGSLTFDLGVKRFVIGNGMKPLLCKLSFELESVSTKMDASPPTKIAVECTSETVTCDCHILMTDAQGKVAEVYQTAVDAEDDILKLSVECENKDFKWEGVTLAIAVRSPPTFYSKSHVTEARFELKGPCTGADALTVQLIRRTDKFSGTCEGRIVIPDPEKRGFRGLLTIGKPGWEQYSVQVVELIGPDAEKQLKARDLSVEVTGLFESSNGTVRVGNDQPIVVEDFDVDFQAYDDEQWTGAYDKDKKAFILKNPKQPADTPNTSPVKVKVDLRLEPELFQAIDKTCSDSLELDRALAGPLTNYAHNFVEMLARFTRQECLDNLTESYYKALGMSDYAVQSQVLTKYLDLAFALRAKVAEQCINNCIGFLIEVGFYYKSWSGSGLAKLQENQAKQLLLVKTKKISEESATFLKGQIDTLSKEMDVGGKRITDLLHKGETLQKQITEALDAKKLPGELINNAAKENLEQLTKLNVYHKTLNETKEAFESCLTAANDASSATGEHAIQAMNELQRRIGLLAAAKEELNKKVVEELLAIREDCLGSDFKTYSQCAREYADKKPMVAADLPAQHTFVQTASDKDDYSLAYAVYEDAAELLKYLVTELNNAVPPIFNCLSHIVRTFMYTNHQIVTEHLDYYSDYCRAKSDLDVRNMNNASCQKEVDILTSRGLANRQSKGTYSTSATAKEDQNSQWVKIDNDNRARIREALVSMLGVALSEKQLLQLTHYSEFRKVYEATGGLTQRVRDYFAAFDDIEKSYWDQFDQYILHGGVERAFNYQDMQNVLDWWVWSLAWLIRVAGKLFSINPPVAIGMAELADILDVGNASIKLALSVLGVLPDATGIVEAVPLLSSMMLRTLTEQSVTLGDAILD